MHRVGLILLAAALAAAAWGAPAHARPATTAIAAEGTWAPGVAAARAYARRRTGTVSFAVRSPGRVSGFRSTRRVRSASVVKAMLMVAFLNRPDVRDRRLTPGELTLLGPMIRVSDNAAANRVSALVGLDGLNRLARSAKMRAFTPYPAWGSSQITAADQARFFENLDARVVRRHRAYALRLLRSIAPYQRWGIARVRPKGWALHFKGGWFPGADAVDHQVALLERGRRRVALAILISRSPSSAYAHETLRGVALRLLRGIDAEPKAQAPPAGPKVPPDTAPDAPAAATGLAAAPLWSAVPGLAWLLRGAGTADRADPPEPRQRTTRTPRRAPSSNRLTRGG